DTEYSAWGNEDGAEDSARDAGWWFGVDGTHFCNHHPTTWVRDIGDAEFGVPPGQPHLVLHDGDTGEADDDGRVSFVRADDGIRS
ncbi:MAG: hypothetical protein ACRDQA_26650, partial [Nocardioidaceae bacterium]